MLDIEIFAFLGRCCHQASVLEHFHTSFFLTGRLLLRTSIPSYLVLCLYLWRLFFSQNFSIDLTFSHRISIGSIHMFLFSLKVTNFYRKSFGDDLLPMVAHGTNGNQWLPSAAVGCHRSPSVGITFYRWLPMGELRTHPKFVFFGPIGKTRWPPWPLWNRWMEFNETWQEGRSQRLLPSLCFSGRSVNKNVCLVWFLRKVADCTQVHDMRPFGPLV